MMRTSGVYCTELTVISEREMTISGDDKQRQSAIRNDDQQIRINLVAFNTFQTFFTFLSIAVRQKYCHSMLTKSLDAEFLSI